MISRKLLGRTASIATQNELSKLSRAATSPTLNCLHPFDTSVLVEESAGAGNSQEESECGCVQENREEVNAAESVHSRFDGLIRQGGTLREAEYLSSQNFADDLIALCLRASKVFEVSDGC